MTEACTADGQTDCVSRLPLVLVDPVFVDASVIKVGSTIAGVGGTLANCNSDGSSGCVTTSDYPSANLAAIDEYDIRAGSVFGGVAGKFRLCKGYADSAKLDKGDVGLDIYDYISIRSLFYGFGKALSADHDDFTADPIADFFSCVDDDNWVKGGVESAAMNGDCNDALDECTLYDKRTKLYVSRSVGTNNAVMWAAAVSHCSGLDYGGFDDWRLPTVREMLDLQGSNIAQFIQNFDSVFMKFKPDSLYWTLDAHPTNGEYSVIPIALPTLESKHKSDHTDGAICVRQDI